MEIVLLAMLCVFCFAVAAVFTLMWLEGFWAGCGLLAAMFAGLFLLSVYAGWDIGYKDGQIKALTGEVDFVKMVNQGGEVQWRDLRQNPNKDWEPVDESP